MHSRLRFLCSRTFVPRYICSPVLNTTRFLCSSVSMIPIVRTSIMLIISISRLTNISIAVNIVCWGGGLVVRVRVGWGIAPRLEHMFLLAGYFK